MENKFTLLDLNAGIFITSIRIKNSFKAIPDVAEGGITVSSWSKNTFDDVNVEDRVNIEGLESVDNDGEFDYGDGHEWDARLDDYHSSDDSGQI